MAITKRHSSIFPEKAISVLAQIFFLHLLLLCFRQSRGHHCPLPPRPSLAAMQNPRRKWLTANKKRLSLSEEYLGNGRKQFAVLKAPRPQFIKPHGAGCGSPALMDLAYCYFHSRTPDGRKRKGSDETKPGFCEVPVLNNDHAIRVAVANVCRSV